MHRTVRDLPLALLVLGLCGGCSAGCRVGCNAGCGQGASSSASTGADRDVVVAGLPRGQLARIGRLRLEHSGKIEAVAFLADGALVSSSRELVRVWEQSGALRWQSFDPGQLDVFSSFATSADGALVAVSHRDPLEQRVAIYERSGRRRASLRLASGRPLAVSRDGRTLAMSSSIALGGAGGEPLIAPQAAPLELVEVPAQQPPRVVAAKQLPASAASFLDDELLIAVTAGQVHRWRWRGGGVERVKAFDHPGRQMALAPDGTAAAWADGPRVTVLQLDAKGEAGALRELVVGGEVDALALAAGGAQLAVGWGDQLAVWSVGDQPRQQWRATRVATSGLGVARSALALSRDGKWLAFADGGKLVVWDAERGPAPAESAGAGRATAGSAATAVASASDEAASFYGFDAGGAPILRRGAALFRVAPGSGAQTPADALFAEAPKWRASSVARFAYGPGGLLMGWDAEGTLSCEPLRVWMRGVGESAVRSARACEQHHVAWYAGPGLVLGAGEPFEVHDLANDAAHGTLLLKGPARGGRVVSASFSANRRWLVVARDVGDAGAREGGGAPGRYVIELVELARLPRPSGPPGASEASPEAVWAPARTWPWRERAALHTVAVLDDGAIFAGAIDGRVLAAAAGVAVLGEVARMNEGVLTATAAPTGKAIAFTDMELQTLVLSAEAVTQARPAASSAPTAAAPTEK